ncbi:16S rRNA (guanine(966)-N(2))-methyltransferase RsmD [Lachnobacterium bovis]|uniref:16S rRNA (Guanine966-N2)-methyltransferase n=1 Tax=Lachnobacterium bovis DSM 14045 TaxID=1122142 RepID=A0A1H3FLU7_9FIRM|nr:16S rRNA (guanine(966)-N(2))-methyltransferase RsmD [Lachnobacterium bovis]SDX91910.1 16S rRNA (guanine966-N2)-methyltransferase [Lachnobacterium bovis DSM 14045]
MRVIAGTARRLPLKAPFGMNTRPTSDQIKETLFNMIQGDVAGAYFLDLFAGSGQMGIEALSRGGLYSVFVENNRKAQECIEDNIKFTKFEKDSLLIKSDVISALRKIENKYKFDIVFMDPPYNNDYEKEVLEYLKNSSLLKEDTLIIIEASVETSFDYLDELGYELIKYKKYKSNAHIFVRKK